MTFQENNSTVNVPKTDEEINAFIKRIYEAGESKDEVAQKQILSDLTEFTKDEDSTIILQKLLDDQEAMLLIMEFMGHNREDVLAAAEELKEVTQRINDAAKFKPESWPNLIEYSKEEISAPIEKIGDKEFVSLRYFLESTTIFDDDDTFESLLETNRIALDGYPIKNDVKLELSSKYNYYIQCKNYYIVINNVPKFEEIAEYVDNNNLL